LSPRKLNFLRFSEVPALKWVEQMRKKLAAIAIAVLVLAAGGAYAAASSTSQANPREAFLTDVAQRLGVSTATLNAALRGAFDDQLSAAVSAGKLTQAQANAIEQRVANGGPLLPGVRFWMPAGPGMAPGFGAGHPWSLKHPLAGHPWPFKHPPMLPMGVRPGFGAPLMLGLGLHSGFRSAAKYLGLTPAKLLSELRAGRSPAQIAAAQGKSLAGLGDALDEALRHRLQRAVSAGLLTPTQARHILARRRAMGAMFLGAHRALPVPVAPGAP
jgi:hypothetical protein